MSDLTRRFGGGAPSLARRALTLVGVASLLAACSGAATPAPTAAPSAAPTAAASSAASAAPSTKASVAPLVANIPNPKIAVTAPPQLSQLQKYGMVLYGSQFGLKSTKDDFVTFNDNVASIASLLSGQSDVIHGAFLSQVSTVVQGQPLKVFGPTIMTDDYTVVAVSSINSLEDVAKPGVTIAVDGPGQGASTRFQAMLLAKGINTKVQDLTGVKIIGSNGDRATAFANGQVQVAVIDGTQANVVLGKVAGSKIVATLQELVPTFIASTFAATTDWLNKNQATAEAICASVIQASREMMKDFNAFSAAAKAIMATPPADAEMRRVWDIVRKYELWPINGDLDKAGFDMMTKIGVSQGIFPTAPSYESVIDHRFVDAAMARLGTVDKATLTK